MCIRDRLYATLSPEEYAAARASTLNAHYTSPTVIKAIYETVGNMGFRTGNILEPSMGDVYKRQTSCGLMVRLVKISAFRSSSRFSFRISSEQSR